MKLEACGLASWLAPLTLAALAACAKPEPTYWVRGTVIGCSPKLTLALGQQSVSMAKPGRFVFPDPLADGAHYTVSVSSSGGAACTLVHEAGTIAESDVDDVVVLCKGVDPSVCQAIVNPGPALERTIGGNVTGLAGTLVLQNNGADDLTLTSDGPFVFPTRVAEGGPYAVTVAQAPAQQVCVLADDTGTVANSNISNVSVTCATDTVAPVVTGFTGVALGRCVAPRPTLTFSASEPLDPATVNDTTVTWTAPGDPEVFLDGAMLHVSSASDLPRGSVFSLTVSASVTDLSGNALVPVTETFFVDAGGEVHIGSSGHLYTVYGCALVDALPGAFVTGLAASGSTSFAATDNMSLCYAGSSGVFACQTLTDGATASSYLTAVAANDTTVYAAAYNNGLLRIDLTNLAGPHTRMGPATTDGSRAMLALALSADTLYAGTSGGLAVTSLAAESWRVYRLGLANTQFPGVAVHDGRVYVANGWNGVAYANVSALTGADSASTFTHLDATALTGFVSGVAIDSVNVYAATNQGLGIAALANLGAGFRIVDSSLLPSQAITVVTVSSSGTLWVGTSAGVVVSGDHGATFITPLPGAVGVNATAIH